MLECFTPELKCVINLKKGRIMEKLLNNLDKIHTTPLGEERIRKNIGKTSEWCKEQVKNSVILKKGKNYYCTVGSVCIVVNASSYTIITAHRIKETKS